MWPLSIVYLLLVIPSIAVAFLSSGDNRGSNVYIILILFTHLFVLLLWYAVSKLEIWIDEQAILYKTLFTTKELAWKEIIDVNLHLGFAGQHPHVKWTFSAVEKNITIESSYFSRSDNRLLAAAVIKKCVKARIAPSIESLAAGKFPWYVF